MADSPLPDGSDAWMEWLFVGAVFVGTASVMVFTGIDAHVEYLLTNPAGYAGLSAASSGSTGDSLSITSDQAGFLNEVSARSLGADAVAAERLYCASVENGEVRNLRLADFIEDSTRTSVAGSCVSQFSSVDMFIHTQPDGSSQLSEEDKDLESTDIGYTCIQYAEITESPLSGNLGGINCWKVVDEGESFDLVSVSLK